MEQIEEDFDILEKYSDTILTYSLSGPMSITHKLAQERGIALYAGIEIEPHPIEEDYTGDNYNDDWCRIETKNLQNLEDAKMLAEKYDSIHALIFANDVLLKHPKMESDLIRYAKILKADRTGDYLVGSANPVEIWGQHLMLAK